MNAVRGCAKENGCKMPIPSPPECFRCAAAWLLDRAARVDSGNYELPAGDQHGWMVKQAAVAEQVDKLIVE